MLGSAPPDLGDDTIYIIPKSYDAFSRKSEMYWIQVSIQVYLLRTMMGLDPHKKMMWDSAPW